MKKVAPAEVEMTPECEDAFRALEYKFTSTSVLVTPDYDLADGRVRLRCQGSF